MGTNRSGEKYDMNRLRQEIKVPEDFDIVFWIEVSRDRDKRYIQEELLKRLKVNPKELGDEELKNMIYVKLKNYRKYLLLLDDVFSNIDLEKVGINDEHKGKVVIASRYKQVCMGTNEEIEVQRVSGTDAQTMFWDRVGMDLKYNPHIKTQAELIIKFCSGMPYLIKLIGNYLSVMTRAENVDCEAIWRSTCDLLTSPRGKPKGDLETVYKSLKFEIDKLEPDDKSCFLYLASFPSIHELLHDYIIECWRAEQFLNDFVELGGARNYGCSLLVHFVNHFLLEKGTKEAQYKMFEFYRRVAPRIARDDNNCVQESRILVTGDSFLSCLPNEPNSKRFSTLLLQKISCFPQIPSPYFEFLRLLELYKAKIETLPSSISSFRNLKAMFLKNCDQLRVLCDEIGDLYNLEILDIRHTGIYNLPLVGGNLTTLKCLRVSIRNGVGNEDRVNGQARQVISPNVLARLHSLEELGIDVNPTDGRWNQIVESVVAEVAALTELTTLCFYFPTVNSFETFIRTSMSWNLNNEWRPERLRSFKIIVGQQQENSLTEFDAFRWSAEKRLRFSAGEAFPNAILKILKKASSFELIAHKAANLSVFSADNLQGLEVCEIKDCPEMTSIIDGDGAAFQCLKRLYIDGLLKLEHIWKNSVIPELSLIQLTNLKLKGCPMLEFLFSEKVAVQLKELQYMQIEQCKVIKEIIKDGSRVEFESSAFPKLKNLELIKLALLSKICRDVSLKCDSLETLTIDACMELKNFPSTFQGAEKLKDIYCNQNLWDQLVWPHDGNATKIRFGNLHRST
ncbi:probable disease resistance protein At4g27220 [Pistacia vera]|uniref:probable disease resistance protein At4g27220 n=1 Tax=Pistacia vera TaxID=55513 RepID=UPI001263057C|nr:probable disease resistance protein At4g27220 [Pistacia vera]